MRTAFLIFSVLFTSALANYDPALGLRSVYYSGTSYCAKASLDSWSCGEPCEWLGALDGFTRIENELLDTFCFVGFNAKQNEVVLSFRGTNGGNFKNWLTNLVYYRVQYDSVPDTQVHSGFYSAYSSISYYVIKALTDQLAKHPGARLLVTGHSMGGALALFAALDIVKKLKPSNMELYTFGSPRVGNQAFTDFAMRTLPKTYQRVTHYTDMIVQVPTRGMGFNHAGNEVWYYNNAADGIYKVCENNPGAPESPNCADSYYLTTGIDAHLNYLGKPISNMCPGDMAPAEGQNIES